MRALRHYLPERAYLITARCFEERFFLAPDTEAISLIVATCLAQAVERYRLEIFAYVVMSNHVHLVVRAPHGGLPEAMQLFFSQVARRVNFLRNRRGPVFSDRYHHQTICDDDALRTTVRYVLRNPTRAGISSSAASWDGLSSFADTCESRVLVCTRRTHGGRSAWSMKRIDRSELGDLRSSCVILPDGSEEERLVLVCREAFLEDTATGEKAHQEMADSLRKDEREDRMGPEAKLRRHPAPFDRPAAPKRTRAPSCIASTSASRKRYSGERRSFVAAYRTASSNFRRGLEAVFPPGCCLPWARLHSLLSCSDTFKTSPGERG